MSMQLRQSRRGIVARTRPFIARLDFRGFFHPWARNTLPFESFAPAQAPA